MSLSIVLESEREEKFFKNSKSYEMYMSSLYKQIPYFFFPQLSMVNYYLNMVRRTG